MPDQTPPIRNFERLVQYARPGKILIAGYYGDSGNVYPEWSEGTAGSGQIVAFNGSTFAAMDVEEAIVAGGGSLASGGLTFADTDPRYVNASGDVMEGHLFQPNAPTASGHLVNKAYADSLISGGEAFSTETSDVVLTDVNAVVFVDSTGGPVDVELPNPHTPGRRITVKDFGTDGDGFTQTNAVTVSPGGAAKIEGVASPLTLTQNKESATFVGDGTNWGRV
jgi:hypothetical protein